MPVNASYVAGDWVAVSAPGRWLLIDLPPDSDLVQRCWSAISSGCEVEDVLDVVISAGVRAAPSFVLVSVDGDGSRAVARGSGLVRIVTDGQPLDVTATGRSVWVDEPIAADVDEITLLGGKPGLSEVELPMGTGVTLAATVFVYTGDRAAPPTIPVNPVETRAPESISAREVVAPPDPEAPPQAIEPAPEEPETPTYDFLFGATQRPLPVEEVPPADPTLTATWEPATPPVEVPEPAPVPAPAPPEPATGVIDSIPGWGASAEPQPAAPQVFDEAPDDVERTTNRAALLAQVQEPPIPGPTVIAGRCPAGHLTPAHSAHCRVCRAEVPEQVAFEAKRPSLGVLQLSTGDSVTLDRGVLIGRAPTAPEDAAERPHLLGVASPGNDVSRAHAEVVLDGWHVFVRDLGSTNGTTVELPGQAPVRLRPGDLQLLESGAVISIADEVRCVFEITA